LRVNVVHWWYFILQRKSMRRYLRIFALWRKNNKKKLFRKWCVVKKSKETRILLFWGILIYHLLHHKAQVFGEVWMIWQCLLMDGGNGYSW
jgi:hypothetical protein